MYKHILYLPDGTQVSSGVPGERALRQVTVTECVSTGQELEPGGVCSTMLEAELLIPGSFTLAAGDPVRVLRVTPEGESYPVGIFLVETPKLCGKHLYQLTGYDRVSLLDRDLTDWLEGLTGWPYTLHRLAVLVAQACGLELITGQIPNGDYPVQKFTGSNITGRRLMQWICQVSGRFCRANSEGQLELVWFQELPEKVITPADAPKLQASWEAETLHLEGGELDCADGVRLRSAWVQAAYEAPQTLRLEQRQGLCTLPGGLEMADYDILPVERVRLCQTQEDVGTVWPEEAGEKCTCTIQGNPLLRADNGESLKSVARQLYLLMQPIRYRPCTVRLPADPTLHAGQILPLRLPDGQQSRIYVMRCQSSGQQTQLECTGSYSRDSSTAVNNQSFEELGGRVLELQTDVDGLRLENRDSQKQLTQLQADVRGIRTRVEDGLQNRLSTLEQTASSLQLRLEQVDDGTGQGAVRVTTATGFTFDESGLRISKQNGQMENLLDNRGMCVSRFGQPVLRADDAGVTAVDVRVHNYLCIGDHSRLEDYASGTDRQRTACFFVTNME